MTIKKKSTTVTIMSLPTAACMIMHYAFGWIWPVYLLAFVIWIAVAYMCGMGYWLLTRGEIAGVPAKVVVATTMNRWLVGLCVVSIWMFTFWHAKFYVTLAAEAASFVAFNLVRVYALLKD